MEVKRVVGGINGLWEHVVRRRPRTRRIIQRLAVCVHSAGERLRIFEASERRRPAHVEIRTGREGVTFDCEHIAGLYRLEKLRTRSQQCARVVNSADRNYAEGILVKPQIGAHWTLPDLAPE